MRILAGIVGAFGGAILSTIIVGLIITMSESTIESIWPIGIIGAIVGSVLAVKSEKVTSILIEFIG